MPFIPLIGTIVGHIVSFFAWIIKKFTVKGVILKAQYAAAIALYSAMVASIIGLGTFLFDVFKAIRLFLDSLPTKFDVPPLLWQVMSASGVTSAIQDAFAIYYPSLVAYFMIVISIFVYKKAKLVSDELFKIGVLTMQ